MQPMSRLKFFVEGLKNLKTTGTITRSSKAVCKGMIKHVDFSKAKCIVELGAGDGVITKYILRSMRPDAKLITFEVLPEFCKILRKINDPRLVVAEDSAENIKKHLSEHGFEYADYVISALPFVNLPDELGYKIVKAAKDNMKPGGLYMQLHYSLLAKKLYEDVFGNVSFDFVVRNVPPAFILRSEKH